MEYPERTDVLRMLNQEEVMNSVIEKTLQNEAIVGQLAIGVVSEAIATSSKVKRRIMYALMVRGLQGNHDTEA